MASVSNTPLEGTGTPRHKMNGQDVFLPVATGPVPSNIKARDDHPVPKDGVVSDELLQLMFRVANMTRVTLQTRSKRTSSTVDSFSAPRPTLHLPIHMVSHGLKAAEMQEVGECMFCILSPTSWRKGHAIPKSLAIQYRTM